MQLPLQTLIYTAMEPGTAKPPDNAGAIGTELSDLSFSDLVQAPAFELPPEPTEAPNLPLTGIPLPSAGKPLPATADLLAAANPTGLLSAEISELAQTLPLKPVRPPSVLPPSARDSAPGQQGTPGVPVLPAGLRETSLSGPRPAIVPESSMQPAPGLPPLARDQAARLGAVVFSGPRAVIAPESQLPAVANVDPLSQPQTPLKGTPAPIMEEPEIKRLTDSQPGNRDNAASSVIAKLHDNRADSAGRVIQDLTTLKMPAETHAAKPSPSSGVPTVQPAIAAVPPGGASPASSVSASASAVTVVTVDMPVFDPAWANALHDRVLWLAGRNIQTAEIRLNPAELGSLQVRISVDDNSVDIVFRATQAATREALEIAMPRLKDMLAENGMSLAGSSVSDQGIADRRDDGNRSSATDIGPSDEESTQPVNTLLPEGHTTREPTGLVDTYV